jgi:hypothetical protein
MLVNLFEVLPETFVEYEAISSSFSDGGVSTFPRIFSILLLTLFDSSVFPRILLF